MRILTFLTALLLSCSLCFAADLSKAVSVGTAATEIVPINPGRKILVLHNNGSNTIFLGFTAADCTVASGLPLLTDTYIIFKLKADPIYGIVASGTEEIRVWEDER